MDVEVLADLNGKSSGTDMPGNSLQLCEDRGWPVFHVLLEKRAWMSGWTPNRGKLQLHRDPFSFVMFRKQGKGCLTEVANALTDFKERSAVFVSERSPALKGV